MTSCFSLATFKIHFAFGFDSLIIRSVGVNLFWFILLGSLLSFFCNSHISPNLGSFQSLSLQIISLLLLDSHKCVLLCVIISLKSPKLCLLLFILFFLLFDLDHLNCLVSKFIDFFSYSFSSLLLNFSTFFQFSYCIFQLHICLPFIISIIFVDIPTL